MAQNDKNSPQKQRAKKAFFDGLNNSKEPILLFILDSLLHTITSSLEYVVNEKRIFSMIRRIFLIDDMDRMPMTIKIENKLDDSFDHPTSKIILNKKLKWTNLKNFSFCQFCKNAKNKIGQKFKNYSSVNFFETRVKNLLLVKKLFFRIKI